MYPAVSNTSSLNPHALPFFPPYCPQPVPNSNNFLVVNVPQPTVLNGTTFYPVPTRQGNAPPLTPMMAPNFPPFWAANSQNGEIPQAQSNIRVMPYAAKAMRQDAWKGMVNVTMPPPPLQPVPSTSPLPPMVDPWANFPQPVTPQQLQSLSLATSPMDHHYFQNAPFQPDEMMRNWER